MLNPLLPMKRPEGKVPEYRVEGIDGLGAGPQPPAGRGQLRRRPWRARRRSQGLELLLRPHLLQVKEGRQACDESLHRWGRDPRERRGRHQGFDHGLHANV